MNQIVMGHRSGTFVFGWGRIGQTTRRSIFERSCTGFNLIPVSSVGEAVGGVSEAAGDEKIEKRSKEHSTMT